MLNNGFYIQIYTKYNEESLIQLFKPKLNKIGGIGICGRNMGYGKIFKCNFDRSLGYSIYLGYGINKVLSVGEIISYKPYRYKHEQMLVTKNNRSISINDKGNKPLSFYDELWNSLFQTKLTECVSLNYEFVCYWIQREKLKQENRIYDHLLEDERIHIIKKELGIRNWKLGSHMFVQDFMCILKYCRLNKLYISYVIIHQVYIEILQTVLNRCDETEDDWLYTFNTFDNRKMICNKIVSMFKQNECMNHFVDKIIYELPIFFRLAISEHYENIIYNSIF